MSILSSACFHDVGDQTWLKSFSWIHFMSLTFQSVFPLKEHKEGRALFPQIEYSNEWQPVGRGDPLKDPTYDYMPPVLDRVRYWGEGNSNKNKNDVLLLGVASKKMSSNKQRDKFTYGPIKRTYYSPPYQQQYAPMHHQQQHYQQQQQQHQQYVWKLEKKLNLGIEFNALLFHFLLSNSNSSPSVSCHHQSICQTHTRHQRVITNSINLNSTAGKHKTMFTPNLDQKVQTVSWYRPDPAWCLQLQNTRQMINFCLRFHHHTG